MDFDITTIKLSKKTKSRIDKLKVHRRETYEEILEKMIDLLNLCKTNPEKARNKLFRIDWEIKRKNIEKKSERNNL